MRESKETLQVKNLRLVEECFDTKYFFHFRQSHFEKASKEH